MMAKKLKKMVKGSRPAPRSAGKSKSARTARPAGARESVVRVSVSIEKHLLVHSERFAAAQKTTVGALLVEGLRKITGAGKPPVLPPRDAAAEPAGDGGAWAQLLAFMEEQQNAMTEIRNALGDVAASLPNDTSRGASRPVPRPRIPPL